MIRVVLNADDLGLAPALTRRVVSLRAEGRVSDVSLLANGAAATEAALGLRAAGVADAGVHLCLVGGEAPIAPAREIPTLLAGGVFRPRWPSVLAALSTGRIRAAEVEREWEAQVAAAAASGLRVTHLDSHQHLHLHPKLFPVAARLARRFEVPFVRAPRHDDPAATSGASAGAARARLLALLGNRARAVLEKEKLRPPPRVLGLAEAGHMSGPRLARLLQDVARLDGDFEVVLHPGAGDTETRARYAWGYAWDAEADGLESDAVAAATAGVTLVSFAALAR